MSFGWTDTFIVILIVTFLILIVWSRIMGQRMLDTVVEIKDMIAALKK